MRLFSKDFVRLPKVLDEWFESFLSSFLLAVRKEQMVKLQREVVIHAVVDAVESAVIGLNDESSCFAPVEAAVLSR